jgi:anionic cell wall polymer biosynthesis LytR-Cps2A-Psr (LCP) family protein
MLNANLDLNITYWVTVSYKALATVVDDLGGIMINVESDEIDHLNNYQFAVAQAIGVSEDEVVPVKETGYQLLNGMQVSAYCRIRYTAGNDFARTKRQQEVIKAILETAKEKDPATLSDVFSDVMNYTYTSIDEKTFLNMILNISDYRVVKEGGFPSMEMMGSANLPAKGDCVIPMSLEANVVELHRFLFGDENYEVSNNVSTFSETIALDTGSYVKP